MSFVHKTVRFCPLRTKGNPIKIVNEYDYQYQVKNLIG